MNTPSTANNNGTPRAFQISPKTNTNTLTPTWRPPKTPLPPHRLAKLANALGVAIPIPSHSGASLSRSWSESSSPADPHRRSPTPSTLASTGFSGPSPINSRYLLHVLPPLSFPYDPDNPDDHDLPPPSSYASGYHTQFRRGILVPVYSSFQAQLLAIAKEYALPSTTGLILYLITTSPTAKSPLDLSPANPLHVEERDEPGPRLSDEIWKHLWTRVIQVEQRDEGVSSRSVTPNLVGIRMGPASQSTPHLFDTITSPLRPLISVPAVENSQSLSHDHNTAPSTPSSNSDPRSNNKSSAGFSASHRDRDDLETPDTSNSFLDVEQQAQSLNLPGLLSPSLIPILAKVEFDIDRRKAAWYDPWLRSRKANHAKRAESRLGKERGTTQERIPDGQGRQPPIQLIIGRQQTTSPVPITVSSAGGNDIKGQEEQTCRLNELWDQGQANSDYQRLSDSHDLEDEDSDIDEAEFDDDEATARVTATDGEDPLVSVFGTDADTWAEIRAAGGRVEPSSPSVVKLATSAADLNALSDGLEENDLDVRREEEEVQELLDKMSPSAPPLQPPSMPTHTTKKHLPPPLVLSPNDNSIDLVLPLEPSPMPNSAGSTNLPYLGGSSPDKPSTRESTNTWETEEELDDRYTRVRSPAESEKRAGTIYDDLDLGLDPTEEFDEDDPNDRRRSQLLLKAQLDEIERTMAQLSPRILETDLGEEQGLISASSPSMTVNSVSLSPKLGMLNGDYYPPSPRQIPGLGTHLPRISSHPEPIRDPPRTSSQQAWPAVSFTSIRDCQGLGAATQTDGPPSPPQLALNGVTTSAPKSFVPVMKTSSNAVSAETERRKRELEEEYPALAKSPSPVSNSTTESPVIPLSPDPFGRYPSTPDFAANSRLSNSSLHHWDTVTVARGSISLEPVAEDAVPPPSQGRSRSATTSRFSADSITGEDIASIKPNMRTTLMTVKSIKRLWRKSNNKSNSNNTPTASSGHGSPPVLPMRPERPSQETMDLPDVEHPLPTALNSKSYSPQPHSPLPLTPHQISQDQYNRPRTSQDQYNPPRTSHDQANGPSAQNLNLPQSKQGPQAPPPLNQGLAVLMPNSGLSVPPPNPGLTAPSFMGRTSPSPIIAAQMLPGRSGSALDKFHFDQESPYPVRAPSTPRYSPRLASPPPLPSAQPQVLPQVPEKDKPTARKSILKVFQRATGTGPLPSPTEPRASFDQQNSNGRSRRPSFHSTKGSVASSMNDIPPSPQVPEQFISVNTTGRNGMAPYDNRDSVRSRPTTSSTDSRISQRQNLGRSASPPRSMASSRESQETRPSFDVSQFEIVSPKTSTLTYPYHGLDHQ